MLNNAGRMDKGILFTVLVLMAFGVVFVFSSSFPVAEAKFGGATFFVKRQAMLGLVAFGGMITFSLIDYKILEKLSPIAYGIAVVLLLMTMVGGETVNGATRWLRIAGQRIQTSEIARIALVITMASQMTKMGEEGLADWRNLRRLAILVGIVILLIVRQPDYSTSMLITAVVAAMLFVGGIPKRFFMPALGIGFAGALAYGLSAEYRMKRILGFFKADELSSGEAFQQNQALMGIGHGGIFGTGLGAGEQKHFFLPESHTDFVFSILGEEVGFIGMTIITGAYFFLIYRGFRVASETEDRFGKLLSFGITMILGFYVLMHSFVNLRMFPVTGVPLPFMSYGGMSLIFTCVSIGILLNISSQSVPKTKETK